MMKYFFFFLPFFLVVASVSSQSSYVNMDWTIAIGGTNSIETNAMTTDNSGNVLIVGSFMGPHDFDPGSGTNMIAPIGTRDFFLVKLDSNGVVLWVVTQGSPAISYTNGYDVHVDDSGNVYTTGYFGGAVDFDPGPAVYNLHSVASSSIFVQKLDPNGNFIWARGFPCSGFQNWGRSITTDAIGNVYLSGAFADTTDFDPGPGVFNLISPRRSGNYQWNQFVTKLDNNGDFIWARSVGGSYSDEGKDIVVDNAGNVYTAGYFAVTVDFDPGPGVFNVTSNGANDFYIQKLDSNGNFVWVKTGGGSLREELNAMVIDGVGNLYLAGDFSGSVDFDPGSGTNIMTAAAAYQSFILKLDSNGDFLWSKSISGSNRNTAHSLSVDNSNFLYCAGRYEGLTDVDPGPAVFNLPASSGSNYYLQKFDNAGNFVWASSINSNFTGTPRIAGAEIATDRFGDFYFGGFYTGTVDFDHNTPIYHLTAQSFWDLFLKKYGQGSCANIALGFDSVKNITCNDSGYIFARGLNGKKPYSFGWSTSSKDKNSYQYFDTAGIYTITLTDSNYCTASSTILINGPEGQLGFDLKANLTATDMRPEVPSQLWVDAVNSRCEKKSGELWLVLDSLVHFDSASISPNRINGDTLLWAFSGLNFDGPRLKPRISIVPDSSLVIGDTLCFEVIVTPVKDDLNKQNNIKRYCFPVVNSRDPNDKQVFPTGRCASNYIQRNEPLTYTIRFQNNGNAPAINVNIIDSLSDHLDLSSTNVVSSSHDVYVEVLPQNVLNFRFDDILLPDSASNEPLSHGYVVFEILPDSTSPNGSLIENSSEIYFDNNAPIITNTVYNTLIDTVPFIVGSDVINACGPQRWIDWITYIESNNNAVFTIYGGASNGCDSIVFLDLSMTDIDTSLIIENGIITAQELSGVYQWLDCEEGFSEIPDELDRSFAPNSNGMYAVKIELNDCVDTSSCISIRSLGIDKNSGHGLGVLYPNPTNGLVNLDLNGERVVDMEIRTLDGQLISKASNLKEGIHTFRFDRPPGVYLIQLTTEEEIKQFKLVKN